MSWLRPKGTVSNFELPSVIMCALSLSCFRLSVFLSSPAVPGVSAAAAAVRTSRSRPRSSRSEWVRVLAAVCGVLVREVRGVLRRVPGVSLRKLISELHSSRWKLFLKKIVN